MDSALLARLLDAVEQLAELFVAELQFWVLCGATYREDGEQSPALHTFVDEKVTYLRKVVEVALVDAGDDIKGNLWMP